MDAVIGVSGAWVRVEKKVLHYRNFLIGCWALLKPLASRRMITVVDLPRVLNISISDDILHCILLLIPPVFLSWTSQLESDR